MNVKILSYRQKNIIVKYSLCFGLKKNRLHICSLCRQFTFGGDANSSGLTQKVEIIVHHLGVGIFASARLKYIQRKIQKLLSTETKSRDSYHFAMSEHESFFYLR